MKNCKRCRLSLPASDFCKHKPSICTICENLRKKKWKKENKDKQCFYRQQNNYKRRTAPPGKYTKLVLEEKLNFWSNKCWICHSPKNITLDHVKPLSKGGTNFIGNIRPCCSRCNSTKSNKWKGNSVLDKLGRIVSSVHQKLKIKKIVASIKGVSSPFLLKHVAQSDNHIHAQNLNPHRKARSHVTPLFINLTERIYFFNIPLSA